jgi:hypothetical protein
MPLNLLGNFARWSGRSEEMRIIAEEMQDPTAKAIMLGLSADYGRLAERAEEEAFGPNRAISRRATKDEERGLATNRRQPLGERREIGDEGRSEEREQERGPQGRNDRDERDHSNWRQAKTERQKSSDK